MVMEYDAQLKLQSYLDGELPEAEAREVANWLARDREAMALFGELRNTRQAFVGLEVGVELPESPAFRRGEPSPIWQRCQFAKQPPKACRRPFDPSSLLARPG